MIGFRWQGIDLYHIVEVAETFHIIFYTILWKNALSTYRVAPAYVDVFVSFIHTHNQFACPFPDPNLSRCYHQSTKMANNLTKFQSEIVPDAQHIHHSGSFRFRFENLSTRKPYDRQIGYRACVRKLDFPIPPDGCVRAKVADCATTIACSTNFGGIYSKATCLAATSFWSVGLMVVYGRA